MDLPKPKDSDTSAQAPPGLRVSVLYRRTFETDGFSLVELLVVIAVMALLASLLMPAVTKSMEAARSLKCSSNLKQLHGAAVSYEIDHKGTLPHPQQTEAVWTDVLPPYLGLKPVSDSVTDGDPCLQSVLSCPVQFSLRSSPAHFSYAMNGRLKIGSGANSKVLTRTLISTPGQTRNNVMAADVSNVPYFLDGTYWGTSMVNFRAQVTFLLSRNIAATKWSVCFPHNDGVNMVFVDGHCEIVARDQGSLSGNFPPHWTNPIFVTTQAF